MERKVVWAVTRVCSLAALGVLALQGPSVVRAGYDTPEGGFCGQHRCIFGGTWTQCEVDLGQPVPGFCESYFTGPGQHHCATAFPCP